MIDETTYLEVQNGNYRVDWEHIGEGWDGDYDPDDPDDIPLLRFSCYRRENGVWEQMDDASYCTMLPTTTPVWFLKRAADTIHDEIRDTTQYRRALEYMSWLSLADMYALVEDEKITEEDLQ